MKFTTGEVLTAGTGKLLCPMGKVYEIMNFLTGDNLFTHQLTRAFRACEGWVKNQHPWMTDLDTSGVTPETWQRWLTEIEQKRGRHLELLPMPDGQWQPCDPIQEAVELMEDKGKIIVVQT